ncbi:MAG: SBBP repeat-containing protein, partial [Vicinamibacterales bacterium]
MTRTSRVALIVSTTISIFLISPAWLLAQQNSVERPLTLAELTYGEEITAIAPAAGGEFWLGGYTCSDKLPTTSDAIQRTWPGPACTSAGFLARMKPDGTIVYLSYWGGSGTSRITALATDTNGNLYIGGSTSSADFLTTTGAYDRTCACTNPDAFVTKVSPDGAAVVFSTYLGGSETDQISSIAVDPSGRVHAAGSTTSPDFPVTSGAFQSAWQPGFDKQENALPDAFYARFSADGTALQYSTYLGGSGDDEATGVAVDASAAAYVVGFSGDATLGGPDFPLLNPAQSQRTTDGFGTTAFLARFNASGAAYSTYLGGSATDTASAVATSGSFVYIAGREDSSDFPHVLDAATNANAYIAEVAGSSGAVTRGIALHGTLGTVSDGFGLAVDQNQVAYLTGVFVSNDCQTCGREADRYPATWDAYKRELNSGDRDALLSVVDFHASTPSVLYSSTVGGPQMDEAFAVMPDGAGGAYLAGVSEGPLAVNGQPAPSKDPSVNSQSFVAHITAQTVTMPTPPADITLYAYDPNGISPTAIAGNWKIDVDPESTAAGGWIVHDLDQGVPKITTPAANPQNYFELEFLAEANVPYHLWLRMRADQDSYQNDSVWVQFSDSVDAGGDPIWRIHSTDATPVSLEDCSGCGEQGWGWNDNGYGVPDTPVEFATSGWHTIRVQQREDGISIDQIVLSSSKWADTAPGANKNDSTILPQSYALPSTTTTNAPPTVLITRPFQNDTYPAPADITMTGIASDSDGFIEKVDIYVNGQLQGTTDQANFSVTWDGLPSGTYTFTAVATDNQGASTTSAPITVVVSGTTSRGLPSGWVDVDVGDPGAPGGATYSDGDFSVSGAGADVWGTSDAFNYAYMPLSGDGTIVAHVTTVSSEANWVKAGVMIRGSLSASSAQAFMLVSHA